MRIWEFRPRRWLVHGALAFGTGVFLGLRVPFSFVWAAVAALCALWALLLRRQGRSPYLAAMACCLFLGLVRCCAVSDPALPEAGTHEITATVSGATTVRETDGRVAVYLSDVRLDGGAARYRAYWTYWPDEEDAPLPLDGQTVSFTGKVYHPSGQTNPYGFDFRLYLLQKGVTIGVSGGNEAVFSPEEQTAPRSLILRLRQGVRECLAALLGEDSALATALLLNDRSEMDEGAVAGFRETGLAHVLTVSGLHMVILFACARLLLRRLHPSPLLLGAVGLTLLAFYALLAGSTAAVLRAGLLMAYLQTSHTLRRRGDRLTGLAAAFLLILVLRPLDLFAAGFQMSFGAVLSMILLGDRVSALTRRIRRELPRRVVRTYGYTLCAALGAALPVAWYFHRVSLVGLLASPLVCLAVTALLPALLLMLLAGFLWLPAGQALGAVLAPLCRLLTGAVQALSTLPITGFFVPRPPIWMIAGIALLLILCTRYVLLKGKTRLLLGGAVAAMTALCLLLSQEGGVRYIQLSVGSADAAVIEDGGATIVIDTSETGSELASYLLSRGRRADMVILTHLHADHVLGLSELLSEGVSIGGIYISTEAFKAPVADACRAALAEAEAAGIPVYTLSAGDELRTDRVTLTVLWPEAGRAAEGADANDFALTLRLDLDGITMLCMSDVGSPYERYSAQPADILRVAHHGSASATGEGFLAAVQPQIAFISTSRASAATTERLAQAGILVYDTSERGALILTVQNGEALLRGYVK
ncbi:MAG: ComEC/Rec2 family competence protein [Clostridia bacterium]|nr:ComEC/Rec2 family competence protein [Clostridia bacterium]